MWKIIIGALLIAWGIGALLHISIMKFILAILLIAFGIKLVLRGKDEKGSDFKVSKSTSSEDYMNEVNIFSAINKSVNSENFKGGKITMIFSGGRIDLSKSKTTEKFINIEAISIFGGVDIIIPKGWKVSSQGTSIVGGFDIKVEDSEGESTLNIEGLALFGGVKITDR